MEYHPGLVLIKAASFLGIVVCVKCMRQALIGLCLEFWFAFSREQKHALMSSVQVH